jgi:hypothetical protein
MERESPISALLDTLRRYSTEEWERAAFITASNELEPVLRAAANFRRNDWWEATHEQ